MAISKILLIFNTVLNLVLISLNIGIVNKITCTILVLCSIIIERINRITEERRTMSYVIFFMSLVLFILLNRIIHEKLYIYSAISLSSFILYELCIGIDLFL